MKPTKHIIVVLHYTNDVKYRLRILRKHVKEKYTNIKIHLSHEEIKSQGVVRNYVIYWYLQTKDEEIFARLKYDVDDITKDLKAKENRIIISEYCNAF